MSLGHLRRRTLQQLGIARSTTQMHLQRRSLYFIAPVLIVPSVIAFVGLVLYQVHKKKKLEEMKDQLYKDRIKWKATDIIYYGKKYARRENSDEVYDHDSYIAALNSNSQPILIGHWARNEDGRSYIKLVDENKEKDPSKHTDADSRTKNE
mmetsp:Transcript_8945/g.13442  ORF Transcript_8945/g.13442 Transcript_8945/m.13442 type:complete len:151 (+) Transcript_8945:61-513(+)|eukprot:CAMPEP_0185033152 /NCGR_PEP_ID=MMETSP1103-20130426/21875_1 /TAXON_ID=36769 /ORGANISM="Paraphysomonas bandaiensis, Strain Caron Lab Isolate" /LENGTH=150 /DNA_ID=CAMNT_0027569327 /DNA_START=1 /DNA_END=453 /DNA_ORIENTATION=-